MSSLQFSKWHPWGSREGLGDVLNFPGIYALAISNSALAGEKFSLIAEISYFGMTNSIAGLRGRLKQFDNTINGKTGHGGAERFMSDYKDKVEKTLVPNLYVAIWPFECDVKSNLPHDLLIMGEVAKAEFVCFAEYSKKFTKLSKYNDKSASPKQSKPETRNH